MSESVKIFAPATVSNVGPGFDLMGFAIDQPGDLLVVKKNSTGIQRIINDTSFNLPEDPEKNVATVAVSSLLHSIHSGQGFDLIFKEKISPGSGIGSSAASCAAAVFGVNELLGNPLSVSELIPFALEGEFIASGSIHADNIAPAILGGFVLIRNYDPIDIIPLTYPDKLFTVVIHPEIEIKTAISRKLIPESLDIKNTLIQCGNIAALISGLATSDYDLIGRSLQDIIAEPVRADLIPGYRQLKNKLTDAGAIGGNISGSGPSIFAFCMDYASSESVAELMKNVFNDLEIENKVYISQISKQGTRIAE